MSVQLLRITALVLALVTCCSAYAQDERTRVAIARIEVPSGVEKDVGPGTLLNLLIESGSRSRQYKPVVPSDYLTRVLEQYRATLGAGLPPPDLKLDPQGTQAELLLLPSVARTSKGWLMTAAVVDLKTLELITIHKAESPDADGWKSLPGELWKRFALLRPRWSAILPKADGDGRIRVLPGDEGVIIESRSRLRVHRTIDGVLLWESDRDVRNNGEALVSGRVIWDTRKGGCS
jgi:hypothetical protein